MLNTFFFGYLSLKWRRLVRTLILIPFTYLFYLSLYFYIKRGGDIGGEAGRFISFTLILLVSTITISYILKPFVVKEDS
jgi:hypothetical protein